MYIIRHKETKQQLGKRYSTAGTAKGAFKTAYMMYAPLKRKYLKFSEQDIYEVVKEETPEMVALEKALDMLKRASHALRNTGSLFYLEVLKCIEEIEGEL